MTRLKNRTKAIVQPVRLKVDPGSKATGMALVRHQPSDSITVLSLLSYSTVVTRSVSH